MKPLYFTTRPPHSTWSISPPGDPLVTMKGMVQGKPKLTTAYIHAEAEELAGFDIPVFLDGNLEQMDRPVEEQEIIMLLEGTTHAIQAVQHQDLVTKCYYLTLKKKTDGKDDGND